MSGEIVDGPNFRGDEAGWFLLNFAEATIRVFCVGPAVAELRKLHKTGRVKVTGSLIRNGRNDSLEILGRRLENPDFVQGGTSQNAADEKTRLAFGQARRVLGHGGHNNTGRP